tara:strand:+ start:894 stop:1271 length:378 start_codon:yes stop_codon:yes gene_type:complete
VRRIFAAPNPLCASTPAGQSEPVKVFDRHPTLSDTQIINYKTSADEKWMVLVGIKSEVRKSPFPHLSTRRVRVFLRLVGAPARRAFARTDAAAAPLLTLRRSAFLGSPAPTASSAPCSSTPRRRM